MKPHHQQNKYLFLGNNNLFSYFFVYIMLAKEND